MSDTVPPTQDRIDVHQSSFKSLRLMQGSLTVCPPENIAVWQGLG